MKDEISTDMSLTEKNEERKNPPKFRWSFFHWTELESSMSVQIDVFVNILNAQFVESWSKNDKSVSF